MIFCCFLLLLFFVTGEEALNEYLKTKVVTVESVLSTSRLELEQ